MPEGEGASWASLEGRSPRLQWRAYHPSHVAPAEGSEVTRTLVLDSEGTIRTIWMDDLDLRALGEVEVTRVSEVEYEHATGEWVAVERATGREIGRSEDRSEAIRQEVVSLERKIIEEGIL